MRKLLTNIIDTEKTLIRLTLVNMKQKVNQPVDSTVQLTTPIGGDSRCTQKMLRFEASLSSQNQR